MKPVEPNHRRSTALVLREAAFTTVVDCGRTGEIRLLTLLLIRKRARNPSPFVKFGKAFRFLAADIEAGFFASVKEIQHEGASGFTG